MPVLMVRLLFLVSGSGVVEDALPVSVSVLPAAAVSLTVMVTVALAALARLPTLQLKVPVAPRAGAVQVPAVVVDFMTYDVPLQHTAYTVLGVLGSMAVQPPSQQTTSLHVNMPLYF
jgi:hypothetical protein